MAYKDKKLNEYQRNYKKKHPEKIKKIEEKSLLVRSLKLILKSELLTEAEKDIVEIITNKVMGEE